MNLLAMEAATQAVSVALAHQAGDGTVEITEFGATVPRAASESLLDLLDDVLIRAGATLNDIDLFATSIGPGMFTGVRTALATVQGLAVGTGRRAVGVDTLAAVALGAVLKHQTQTGAPAQSAADAADAATIDVGVLMDARRSEVYGGLYRVASRSLPSPGNAGFGTGDTAFDVARTLECLKPPALYRPTSAWQTLVGDVPPPAGGRWAVGSGIAEYPALADVLGHPLDVLTGDAAGPRPDPIIIDAEFGPTARAVALLALVAGARGKARTAAELAPLYLRGALD